MTDQELSLKIAESLEPKPEWPLRKLQLLEDRHGGPGQGYNPSTIAWICKFTCNRAGGVNWNSVNWIPRDFVNDPAMTVMLMDLLLDEGFVHFDKYLDRIKLTTPSATCQLVEINKLGRAVAEAYAKPKRSI